MRILIITDAWLPQVNGVVRTLASVSAELGRMGHEVELIAPDQFRSLPCPTYPEIRLALTSARSVGERIARIGADAIHIATEGPLGVAARAYCLRHGLAFTTAYHTQFPDYLSRRTRLPARLFWRYIRWFHAPSRNILVSTPSLAEALAKRGLTRTALWGRGVDLACFGPHLPPHPALVGLARPIQLYVGRVAVEKNVEAFLDTRIAGSKVVVGDGPQRISLEQAYPRVRFTGALHGRALASAYATADLLVFPSRTDTFGLVMIEALACGTPVAAFPVPGPADVLTDAVGAMDEDLDAAISRALACDRDSCARYGAQFGWRASARQFRAGLVPLAAADAVAA